MNSLPSEACRAGRQARYCKAMLTANDDIVIRFSTTYSEGNREQSASFLDFENGRNGESVI